MGTVLTIIAVVAIIGALFGFFGGGGGKSEDAIAGAIVGSILAGSCLFQLFMYGLGALAGLWIIKLIFF